METIEQPIIISGKEFTAAFLESLQATLGRVAAEHLKRAAAFDLIIGWRILACVKAGRTLPQLSALSFYTQDELAVLWAALKKSPLRKTRR